MRIRNILAGSAAIIALLPATAMAQTATTPTASTDVGEVIVTARKREERLKDVPIAVTAVSSDTLEREQIYAVKDIAAFAPGLTINSDAVGRAFVSIRGIGTTLIDTVQPGVGIFIDGVYLPNTSYLNSPLLDVERIEVLRGPQGTLFGNNTLGGAINVVTKQPSNTFRGKISGAYAGPDDFRSAAISLSGPIVQDVLQGRLAASYHSRDGFSENALAGGLSNPLEQNSINGALRWEAAPGAVITLNGYYDKVSGGQTPYIDLSGPTDYSQDATLNLNSIATYEYKGANIKGVFDADSLGTVITAMAAYDRKTGSAVGDGDFGPIDFIRISNGHNDSDNYTAELRFDTTWNDNVSTLFGLFANTSEATNGNDTTLVPFAITATSVSTVKTEAQAVFGTVFWKLGNGLEVTGGLRYDHQRVEATISPDTYESYQLEPRLTVTKIWSPRAMTYLSVSRGFRGGGSNGAGAPNPIYRGDSVWTYEAGTKLTTEDRSLSLDAAIFYNDYDHYIGQNSLAPKVPGPGFVAINLNSGKVESYGLELEGRWRVSESFTLTGGGTLLHARITDGAEYTATTGLPLPSDRLLFQPDWNYYVTGSYVVPIGADDLRLDATVVGKGDRVGSSLGAAAPTLESYTLVNASITWTHNDINIALFATNLFDEKYLESYLDSSILTTAGLGGPLANNLGIQGDRRRAGIRASLAF
jgi:iron complex outermembrane receptor protein